jgi:hypothetical protein
MTSFGDQRDIKVRKFLEGLGFTVGSRRKVPGPADLLAVRIRPDYSVGGVPWPGAWFTEVLLAEVKATQQSPWERFGAMERSALAEEARKVRGVACMAWWPAHAPLTWYVIVDEKPGVPWDGPGTMLADDPTPEAWQRRTRPRAVAPPATRPGMVGPRPARRSPEESEGKA